MTFDQLYNEMIVVVMHLIVQPYTWCIVEAKQERILSSGTKNVI